MLRSVSTGRLRGSLLLPLIEPTISSRQCTAARYCCFVYRSGMPSSRYAVFRLSVHPNTCHLASQVARINIDAAIFLVIPLPLPQIPPRTEANGDWRPKPTVSLKDSSSTFRFSDCPSPPSHLHIQRVNRAIKQNFFTNLTSRVFHLPA